jgi:hypothetical protein
MTYPPAGATANEGMVPKASKRRRKIIAGAEIGRVSQATKVAQAAREVYEPGLTNAPDELMRDALSR